MGDVVIDGSDGFDGDIVVGSGGESARPEVDGDVVVGSGESARPEVDVGASQGGTGQPQTFTVWGRQRRH